MNDEAQIRDLIDTWMSATKSGDADKVLSLMTDDVVFLVAGQPPFGKEKFAATLKPPAGTPLPTFEGRSEVQEVKVVGDHAFVRTHLEVTATLPDGKVMKRAGHTLSVMRKTHGRWQLARDANLLVPIPL